MTPVEIAYFKHFMYDKQLQRDYLFYYRRNGIKNGNPESIEQYFLQTTVEDVIMKAFLFYPSGFATNEKTTFDYWKDIDDQWQQYMRAMSGNIFNVSWPQLSKSFAILRQNWDIPFYWRRENLESTEEVYKRMNINLPLPEMCWEHGYNLRPDENLIKFKIQDAKDGDVIVRIHKCVDHVSRLIILFRELSPYESEGLQMQKVIANAYYNCFTGKLKVGEATRAIVFDPESKDVVFRLAFDEEKNTLMSKLSEAGLAWDKEIKALLPKDMSETKPDYATVPEASAEADPDIPEIDFVEFDSNRRVVCALTKGIISVNTRNHSWRVTINRTDSKEIKKKQVKFAMVGKTKNGDVMMMLCNNYKGMRILFNTESYYNINSRQFCDHLKRLLGTTDDLLYLNIEKVSEKIDSITYKVTRQ